MYTDLENFIIVCKNCKSTKIDINVRESQNIHAEHHIVNFTCSECDTFENEPKEDN